MIDVKLLRDDPEAVRASQRARGADEGLVDSAATLDAERRAATAAAESLRAEQKALGRGVASSRGDERTALVERGRALAGRVKDAAASAEDLGVRFEAALGALANVVAPGVPAGGEDDFVVLREVGQRGVFEHPVRDHLEIGEGLRAIDVERGAKVSGSRFYFLTGVGARLELALLNLAVATALEAGFTPMITPTLVRPQVMAGTGYLGAHASEVYHLPADDLYLVGTSEVALAGYHADEVLDLSDGPLRYAGWSACYRREAGSYGRDTRGIIRVHQFHKVEMFSFARVEDAEAEHQRLLAWEEGMLAAVELPYRVIETAAGDLGASAARKYDCEAWLPSQSRYLELTSTSNCTTFQARRLGIREKGPDGANRPVATLNGTLATTRWLVAILENHQRADGSVHVPAALRPHLQGLAELTPPA